MQDVFEVVLTDPVLIDKSIYSLWVSGNNLKDAIAQIQQRNQMAQSKLLWRNLVDQYRLFEMLKHYLVHPHLLSTQLLFQIPPKAQSFIIEQYYTFDPPVIRRLLGKKLTTKFRKDLDDVTEHTHIAIQSCRRQFDNCRRIYSALEDLNFHGNIWKCLSGKFSISNILAWKYTCLIFLFHSHFELFVSQKTTFFLPWESLEFFASLMIIFWLPRSQCSSDSALESRFLHLDCLLPKTIDGEVISTEVLQEKIVNEYEDIVSFGNPEGIELDHLMTKHLRAIKSHLINDKSAMSSLRHECLGIVKSSLNADISSQLDLKFSSLIKEILRIGGGLCQTKELKTFFEDVVHMGKSFKEIGATVGDINVFLCSLNIAFQSDKDWLRMDDASQYLTDWKRYLGICRIILTKIFPDVYFIQKRMIYLSSIK